MSMTITPEQRAMMTERLTTVTCTVALGGRYAVEISARDFTDLAADTDPHTVPAATIQDVDARALADQLQAAANILREQANDE